MLNSLVNLSHQRRYWLALVVFGLALESVALYYQYGLGEWPCVLCIQVRIWVAAFILLGIVGLFSTASVWAMRILHSLGLVVMLGLGERSWQLLAVERGWTFGECSMDLGLPAWFALDKWAPRLFEVQTTCGYTPVLLFGITMAEALLVFSALLVIITAALCVASWFPRR